MESNCIFCRIIAGEIPSATVYEDEDFKVILDISPAVKGHMVILPKKHAANLFELEEEIASKALLIAKKVAAAVKEELNCDGINLLQNNGEAAGQTVFHFHMHIIPRYQEDTVNMTWTKDSYTGDEATELAVKIGIRI